MVKSDSPSHSAGAAGRDTEKWLRRQWRLARRPISLAAGLGVLGGLLLVPQAWLLAQAMNGVVLQRASLSQVLPWLLPLPIIFALRFVAVRASEQAAMWAATRVKEDVRSRLVRHLQALGPAYVQSRHSGELVVAAVDGIEALEAYYARYLPHMALVALLPLSILAFIFPKDWISGAVLLLTAPLIPLFMVLIGSGAERLNQRQWRKLARMSGYFLDALQGLTTLKLFNASRREAELIARISEDYRRSTMSVLRSAFLSALVLEFFATVSIAVVAVLIGFRLLRADIGFEAGFFILLLAPEFYLPLRTLGAHYHARMEAIGAAERIVEVLGVPSPQTAQARARPLLARALEIRFEDVHFAYGPGREALRGTSFDLAAERLTALVGPSGAGKTTVLNVLLGFVHAQRGRVLVGGHDLTRLDPDYWLRHIAWLPQRAHLFRGTILDNIRMADPGIAFEAVRAAARGAHADEFIERLPQGYDTAVGERGQNLSGGQVQRLALARAFLKDAPLLLMDEATASLDPATEALVTQAIARLAKARTVLIIAHRLRTVRRADCILVMDGGRVVEQGTHDILARGETRYARMVGAREAVAAMEQRPAGGASLFPPGEGPGMGDTEW
ncbi:MAG TPA: thiol reductant ABC exporter subunit CydD [Burkholderiales bacterium]|nr:thiol reductant ABC exporter subunit CydD [Burkholderiales bacterium]